MELTMLTVWKKHFPIYLTIAATFSICAAADLHAQQGQFVANCRASCNSDAIRRELGREDVAEACFDYCWCVQQWVLGGRSTFDAVIVLATPNHPVIQQAQRVCLDKLR
jgi:hypothetical protein